MGELAGQKVLVVGGSSGIGLGAAIVAAEAGAAVTIASRSNAKLAAAIQQIGHGAEGRVLDATDDVQVAGFFADGAVWDHVVASAGKGGRGRITDQSTAEAMDAMDAKFWAYWRVARAARIAPAGSLTFVSGGLARKPAPGAATTSAINAAIHGLTRGLALDFAPVRVNTVCPGMVETPLWDRIPEADRRAMYERTAATLPVGRIGQPADIGQAILFLMTSRFTTGSVLVIEGGSMLL